MRTKAEIKMELKNSVSQLENSGKALHIEWSKQKIDYQDAKVR